MAGKTKKDGLSAGNGSVVIGGNVERSNVVVGNNNVVSNKSIQLAAYFEIIVQAVENTQLAPADKLDVKAELQEIQTALEAPTPDETFLARRFRNIKRMAPDIVDVAFETLKNPIGGVAEVIKRVAKKMTEDANAG
ncbi:MAG: hypothetical protein Q8L87_07255 [Anaerolineales bacterium]|nr:hypothetical protein [Anaerolineales bacterium]